MKEKGFVQIILIIGIVAALAVIGYVLLSKKSNLQTALPVPSGYQSQYNQGTAAAPQIQNSSDLNSASSSLDTADTTQIDAQLKALDSASAGF